MIDPGLTRASASVALLAAVLTLPSAVLAQDVSRIELPDGWQPEGITTDGQWLYAGSLANGAIWRADPATGEGEVLVPGTDGAVAVGLDAEVDAGRLWVAGGRTGEVRAYDAESGDLLATYPFSAGFLNDVAVTDDFVYVTDSFMPQLIVIPLSDDGSLAAADAAAALPITGDLEYGDGFNVNGIVATEAGLVTVHSPTGALYRLDPATAASSLIDTGEAELSAGDGLELDGSTLYVVRNQLGQVAVVELAEDLASATQTGLLSPGDVDVPTTAALVGDALWAVNARFGTAGSPTTEYWITRVDIDS